MARLLSPLGRTPAALAVLCAGLAVGVAGAAQRATFNVGPKQPSIPRNAFAISSADVARPLRPGTSQPLELRLSNPHGYSLAITRLEIAVIVDPVHARAGCDGTRDFRVIGVARSSYPIRLAPRRTVSLRRLRPRAAPRVAMRSLARMQDACKGARLTLRFGGRARPWSTGSRR